MKQAGFFDFTERQKKLLATRDFSGTDQPDYGVGSVSACFGRCVKEVAAGEG